MTLSGNSLRQTVHTHHASVHQAAKLVAALLRVTKVTASLAEMPGLWLTSPAGWLPRTEISSGTIRSVIEYGLALPFLNRTTSVIRHPQLRWSILLDRSFNALMLCWRQLTILIREKTLQFSSTVLVCTYTISVPSTLWVRKKQDTKLLPITSPNVNRFSKFTVQLSSKFAKKPFK